MSTNVDRPSGPNASADAYASVPLPATSRFVHVPPRLARIPGLRAMPLALTDEPVIYALCTRRTVAPGRVEGEALYVGETDDLHRRLSEHRQAWWREHREPYTVCLWWEHPAELALEHGITVGIAEAALKRYLRPRYNGIHGDDEAPLSGQHIKALELHGITPR